MNYQNRNKMLVTTTANYGSSKSSTTALAVASAPQNPNNLAEGALGIYVLTTISGTEGLYLLGNTGETATATMLDADNAGINDNSTVMFYQGTSDGAVLLGSTKIGAIKQIRRRGYSAPVKRVDFIGYNGTTGGLNLPTIIQNDEAVITFIERYTDVDYIDQRTNYNAVLTAGEGQYSILNKLCKQINNDAGTGRTPIKIANIVGSGTQAAYTGTSTALKFTKGSDSVAFMIASSGGLVASTGSITAGDVIVVPHQKMTAVTFTASALGSSAGRHLVYIGETLYNVADAGTDAQNAAAIAAAINAGNLATASVATAAVTITLNKTLQNAKILVISTADDTTFSEVTLTVTATETSRSFYKAATTVSGGATFLLDRIFPDETMFTMEGTTATIHSGVVATPGSEFGLRLEDKNNFANIEIASPSEQVLSNADITNSIGAASGSGHGTMVVAWEKEERAGKTLVGRYEPILAKGRLYATESTNYDLFIVDFEPQLNIELNKTTNVVSLTICTPTGGSSTNTNLADGSTGIFAASASKLNKNYLSV